MSLRPDVRKRMLIVGPFTSALFAVIMGVLMMQEAPTSVVVFVAMGMTIFLVMTIVAYAWPRMTVDGMRCPRCGAEVREDFVVCPVCTINLGRRGRP